MFVNRSEAHSRVFETLDDVRECCEVEDDFYEWKDIAASSITAFIEDLTAEQLEDTCGAFKEYIKDADTDRNMAQGIKSALIIALSETIDYIGNVSKNADRETYQFVGAARCALKDLKKITL